MNSVRIIGDGVRVGHNSSVVRLVAMVARPDGPVRIGEDADFAPRCALVSGTHEIGGSQYRVRCGHSAGVTIGHGTWVGAGSIVLAGVTIRKGVVVAADAVVVDDAPDDALVADGHARVVREPPVNMPLPDHVS